jgi:hypothetical protein
MAKRLPEYMRDPDYFKKQGAKGGKKGGASGGKQAAANMTPAERKARAVKGGKARAKKAKS